MQSFISTSQQVTFQAELEHGFLTVDVNDHLMLTPGSVSGGEEGTFLYIFNDLHVRERIYNCSLEI
jgi:hypothetical protein